MPAELMAALCSIRRALFELPPLALLALLAGFAALVVTVAVRHRGTV